MTTIVVPRKQPGCIVQSVTYTGLTVDPGVTSLIPAGFYTSVEIDHAIISTVILLPLIQEGLSSVTSIYTKYWFTAWSSLPRKKCDQVR